MISKVNTLILVVLASVLTSTSPADARDFKTKEINLDADSILGTFDNIQMDFVKKKVKARILKKFDTDNSGAVQSQQERDNLVSYFRKYDVDQNSVLSRKEFRSAMESLKEKSGGKRRFLRFLGRGSS